MLKLTGAANAILIEGMGGRLKTRNGGLRPLKHRINAHQMAKRRVRIAARRTVAEQLVLAQRALAFELYRRTFRGRLNILWAHLRRLFVRRVA